MFFNKGRETEQLATIREKLAAAEIAVVDAEQALREGALAAALSPDPAASAEPQREALRRAREYVELLGHAENAAEEAERQAIARAQAAVRASQNRGIRQRISALTKAAKRYEVATAECVAAYRDMVATGADIRKLLPREFDNFAAAVSPGPLERMCSAELGRVGSSHPLHPGAPPTAPGAEYYGHADGGTLGSARELPPLADRLKSKLLAHYNHLVGQAPAPVPVAEPRRNKPARPPSPTTTAGADLIPPAEPISAEGTEPARPMDLSKIHPYDPGAKAGFLAEMALMRGRSSVEADLDIEDEAVEADPIEELAETSVEVEMVELADIEVEPAETAVEVAAPQPSIGQILHHLSRR